MTAETAPKRKSIKRHIRELGRTGDELGLKTVERYLLVALFGYTDNHGWCFPSVGTISRETGMGERSIKSSFKTLELAGLVKSFDVRSNEVLARLQKSPTFEKKSFKSRKKVYLLWFTATQAGRYDAVLISATHQQPGNPETKRWYVAKPSGNTIHTWDELVVLVRKGKVTPNDYVCEVASSKGTVAINIADLAVHFPRCAVRPDDATLQTG